MHFFNISLLYFFLNYLGKWLYYTFRQTTKKKKNRKILTPLFFSTFFSCFDFLLAVFCCHLLSSVLHSDVLIEQLPAPQLLLLGTEFFIACSRIFDQSPFWWNTLKIVPSVHTGDAIALARQSGSHKCPPRSYLLYLLSSWRTALALCWSYMNTILQLSLLVFIVYPVVETLLCHH